MSVIKKQSTQENALKYFRSLVSDEFSLIDDNMGVFDDYDFCLMLQGHIGELAEELLDTHDDSVDFIKILVKINALIEMWSHRKLTEGPIRIG